MLLLIMSPLTQGRGLKHMPFQNRVNVTPVAPHTGAWIETSAGSARNRIGKSPLTQGRGLKLIGQHLCQMSEKSPLTQGRGLKLIGSSMIKMSAGSPLTQGRGLKLSVSATIA